MQVKFMKLNEKAVMPSYAKAGDAGLDLTAVSAHLEPQMIEYKTGLAVEIPEGYVGLIFPRSSIFKFGLDLTNCVGVIDSGYRGEICFKFRVVDHNTGFYKSGDRIGQLIILPYPKIEPIESKGLSWTVRGFTGFGSSGR